MANTQIWYRFCRCLFGAVQAENFFVFSCSLCWKYIWEKECYTMRKATQMTDFLSIRNLWHPKSAISHINKNEFMLKWVIIMRQIKYSNYWIIKHYSNYLIYPCRYTRFSGVIKFNIFSSNPGILPLSFISYYCVYYLYAENHYLHNSDMA